MPAAPSLEALFDTQATFESALSAYASANGLSAYTSRTAINLPDSRVECQFVPGGAQGHQATRTTTGTGWPEQDMFTGTISWRVQTERAIVGAQTGFASVHDYRVARIKTLMLRGALNGTIAGITALSLPYHRLAVEGFSGQTPTVEDDAYDVTELGWNVAYQILGDAWPAVVAP
jgi:hypothetical protein